MYLKKDTKDILYLIGRYRNAIMGFAALYILFFHEWIVITGEDSAFYFAEKFIKRIGFYGVDIFFFLSGMGLIYSIEKHNVLEFYKRRFVRVFIPFFIMAIIISINKEWGMETFLKNVFGINFYIKSIYSYLWFVPAIMNLYILFPIYYFFFKKSPNKGQFTMAVLIIWLFLAVYFRDNIRFDLYGFINRIPIFLIGVLAGWTSKEREIKFTGLTWGICLMTFGLGLYFAYLTCYKGYYLVVPSSNCCIPNILLSITTSCLLAKIFYFCDEKLKLFGKAVMKVFVFFGTISLEFYCVQEWLAKILKKKFPDTWDDMVINIAVFIAVTITAIALYGVCKLIHISFGKIKKIIRSR